MAEYQLSLGPQEREYLLQLLHTKLGETRVEAHRTHSPDFRERVLAEEVLQKELIAKLETVG